MIAAVPSNLKWRYSKERGRLFASGSQLTADFIQIRWLIKSGRVPRNVSAIVYKADKLVMVVRGRYLEDWISGRLAEYN